MLELIWLLPALPLLGFLALALSAGRLPARAAAAVGAGSVGLSFALAAAMALEFLAGDRTPFRRELWTWMAAGDFSAGFAFHFDGLALTMTLVITGVGFLIHLYATGYMAGDPGYSRFFCYMNLFVAAMLVLVLGDNLALLYLGWEGVGLCSYLLIGFWHADPDNGRAARKAFVVTRVGDASMALGLFLLFAELGTLNIQDMLGAAEARWPAGSGMATAASLLLLGGAVGKSAQLPLQTWLPDAMAGPTPISALIHAATMVTAGVYLIARVHPLFELAPAVLQAVAWVGLLTLLLAGFSALVQRDIKRILAYSTMSQIGYMFLGLGVGAWSASVFHLMTHAFFKALLFLGAGTVILSLHHEQDIFRMGGLRAKLPVAFASFLVGGLALTAFPYTSGYFSKDAILLGALEAGPGGVWLWAGGVAGAFLTGLYTFRMIFVAFFGAPRGAPAEGERGGWNMSGPLALLLLLSLAGGLVPPPLEAVFGPGAEPHAGALVHAVMIAAPLAGAAAAWLFFHSGLLSAERLAAGRAADALRRFWFEAWGMDALYDALVVRPFTRLARANRADLVDAGYDLVAALARRGHALTAKAQTGRLGWYALSVAGGLALLLAAGALL